MACGRCLVEPCAKCGGAFDACNTAMDAVVSWTTADCDHAGCGRYVTYHDLAGHRGECPHAPCVCTVPGCAFAGPAPALLSHLTTPPLDARAQGPLRQGPRAPSAGDAGAAGPAARGRGRPHVQVVACSPSTSLILFIIPVK
ncbi:hypothetical protein ZWY2020_053243 [Hordeum vulgare]|nr:hypothetical protein ZWY2020_053243 [Hordeum vulgare]